MKYRMGIDVSDRCFSSVNLAMLVFFARSRRSTKSSTSLVLPPSGLFPQHGRRSRGPLYLEDEFAAARELARGKDPASVVEPIRVISLEMSDIDESAVDFDVVAAGKGYPPGFVRLPTWIGEEFCRQLTAEPFNAEKAAWSQVARPE
jgi:hypothetical protein